VKWAARRRRAGAVAGAADLFLRGFVATALLTAVQKERGGAGVRGRRVLRHAVQGGLALASGSVAASAILRRDYGTAAMGVVAGAAGILVTEHLLASPQPLTHAEDKENGLGQEDE